MSATDPRPSIGDLMLDRLDTEHATAILGELIAVYNGVYGESNDPFFGEERYRKQITSHMTVPGWEAVTGRVASDLVAYAYGFPLQPDTSWWGGLRSMPEEGFTTETGTRTFAISEIMVREPWRRHGIARALHDHLLAGRSEARATLLVEPGNEVAQSIYAGWGWRIVAQLRPGWDGAPPFDVAILVRRAP